MSEEEKKEIEIMLEDIFFWKGKSSFITRHRYKELSKKMYKEIEKLQQENHQLKDEKIDQIFKGVEEEVLEEMRTEVRTLRKENQELKEKIREYEIGMLRE